MIALILAHDEAGGIGCKNGLPWSRIPQDMSHFRRLTSGRAVIMGRNTFESLDNNPLPTRLNIVLSSTYGTEAEAPRFVRTKSPSTTTYISLVNSLEKAFRVAKEYGDLDTFVIGGAKVYEQCLSFADKLFVTKVAGIFEADTFWKPDLTGWKLVSSRKVTEEDILICTFEEYVRDIVHDQ